MYTHTLTHVCIYVCIYTYTQKHTYTHNLISLIAPTKAHTAVRASLLFYVVLPQGRGTLVVKPNRCFCALCTK